MRNWLLPEYIEDILPPQAWRMEQLRRAVLDVFRGHGYQLVMPPMLEYVESLLVGSGHDLNLATFKLVDQLSGRHMGLRADITPQAARIDAHLMNLQGVDRLCYAGTVLRTLPDGIMRTREPLQVGAEIFGHATVESDIEIQRLLLEVLRVCQVGEVVLDLGHVGIFRALSQRVQLPAQSEAELFSALQCKDTAAIAALTAALPSDIAAALRNLPQLSGGAEVLQRAREVLPKLAEITAALNDLRALNDALQGEAVRISFDLSELRGYHYHSGIVFAAYAEGFADAVGKGGRYDHVGKAFGRARPATGFSLDLREVAAQRPTATQAGNAILAPCVSDVALQARIAELRAAGEVVVLDLPGHDAARSELGCNRRLSLNNGQWQLAAL